MAFAVNEQARKEANLRLLQRSSDPSITDILGSATHVVLYHFQQSTQSWQKSNVEGSLFLAVRGGTNDASAFPSSSSSYLLVILNRNSPENFQIIMDREFQLQHKDPYLIFKQPQLQSTETATAIRGIWFPNAQERIQINDLLTHVLQTLRSMVSPSPPQPPPVPSSSSANPTPDPVAMTAALLSPLSLGTVLGGGGGGGGPSSTAPFGGGGRGGGGGLPFYGTNNASATGTVNNNNNSSSSSLPRQPSPSQSQNTPMLDKKSLQLALLSLIQDDRFLDLLHAQYLKVARARANRNNRPPDS